MQRTEDRVRPWCPTCGEGCCDIDSVGAACPGGCRHGVVHYLERFDEEATLSQELMSAVARVLHLSDRDVFADFNAIVLPVPVKLLGLIPQRFSKVTVTEGMRAVLLAYAVLEVYEASHKAAGFWSRGRGSAGASPSQAKGGA